MELAERCPRCSSRMRLRPGGAPNGHLHVAPPGIDPLDPRNIQLEARLPGRVVRPLGVDLERPFCLQVLELDRWDDPHAAIETFRPRGGTRPSARARGAPRPRRHRELAGGQGDLGLRRRHRRRAAPHHLRGPREPRGRRAAAARPHGDRALAPRGLRLAPFEALWKRTPVVGGPPLAIRDGVDGFLAPEPEEAAAHIVELVATPASPPRWAAPGASACASSSW